MTATRIFAVSVVAAALAGCGGGSETATRTVTVISRPHGAAPSDEILSVAGLGAFRGRCPASAPSWEVRFLADAGATDTVSYRVGTGRRRTVNINPGGVITFRLVPRATRTREPADRFVPPIGQGRGRATAMAVPTTQRLQITLYQGTEPQTLRADVSLALATIGGESGQCVLVGSNVDAYTYPN